MSYDIIKSIKIDIKNKKVFITSCSSSILPRYYSCDHCPYYDQFFDKEGGIEEIKKKILFNFFSGGFQGLSTNYGKAFSTFKYEGDSYEIWDKCRKDPEFKINFQNQLLKHFNEYEAKRKCKRVFNVKIADRWIVKLTSNSAITCGDQNRAKKFDLATAEIAKNRFARHGSEIVELT
jgi:hypothetical protein